MNQQRFLSEAQAFELSHNWDNADDVECLTAFGVPLSRVIQVKVFELLFPDAASVDDAPGWRNGFKSLGFDWRAKFLYSRFLGQQCRSDNVIWAIYDVNNKACIDVLNAASVALHERVDKVSALSLDPAIERRVDPKLERMNWTSEFRMEQQRLAARTAGVLRNKFHQNLSSYQARMSSAGVSDEVIRKILSLFERQIGDLVREIVAWKSLLEQVRPELILLSNDAHRAPRILTVLAQSQSIPVVCLQHGYPVWSYGYVPVFADLLLVWGESSENWFLERGVSKDRMVRIGDLRKGKSVAANESGTGDTRPRRLIWMPNPVGRKINERMGEAFFRLADKLDLPITVKLHPSEKDRKWYVSQVPRERRSEVVVTNCTVEELRLRRGDLVVVGNSTVGIEAVSYGAFVVNLVHESLPNSIDYERHGVGVTLDCCKGDIRSAVSMIEKAVHNPKEKERQRFLESVYEDLSLNAAEKLVRSISSLLERGSP